MPEEKTWSYTTDLHENPVSPGTAMLFFDAKSTVFWCKNQAAFLSLANESKTESKGSSWTNPEAERCTGGVFLSSSLCRKGCVATRCPRILKVTLKITQEHNWEAKPVLEGQPGLLHHQISADYPCERAAVLELVQLCHPQCLKPSGPSGAQCGTSPCAACSSPAPGTGTFLPQPFSPFCTSTGWSWKEAGHKEEEEWTQFSHISPVSSSAA